MRRSLLIPAILFLVLALAGAGCTTTPTRSAAQTTPPISNQSANLTANASVPNITGRWSGLTDGYVQGSGFFRHDAGIYTITEQQGYGFAGYKEYLKPDGNKYYENFSGAITPGGEVIMADNVIGYSIGRVTGPDSMELLYGEDGPGARAFIQLFTRQKE